MSSVKIQPIADRILVEPIANETKTRGGIIIPDTAQEKPLSGLVIAVGKGRHNEPMTIAVGDVILYSKQGGTEIKHDGKEYLIMNESDTYAII